MTGLTVNASVGNDIDLFGKTVSDLQSNVIFGKDNVTGTLNYVDDYIGFSGDSSLTSGNYIVMRAFVPDQEDVTITVTVTNPVVLDDDGIAVLRIADKSTQTITVVASKEGYDDVTRVFTLDQLVCETE